MTRRAHCSFQKWSLLFFLAISLITLAHIFGFGISDQAGGQMLPSLGSLDSSVRWMALPQPLPSGGGIAPFTLEFQTCGDFTSQRLQLVLGIATAVIWGAQVVFPERTTTLLDLAGKFFDRKNLFTSVYNLEQEAELRSIFKEYWCKQPAGPASQLWCSSQATTPVFLTSRRARELLSETLTPQTLRHCREFPALGQESRRFGEQTWKYWSQTDGSNVFQPLNIEMVKCECAFNAQAMNLQPEDLDLFWKVDASLKFADHISDAVRQLQGGLAAKFSTLALKNAQKLGYFSSSATTKQRYHVLQISLQSPCDGQDLSVASESVAESWDNCFNNTLELGNVLLSEAVDPTLPVYIMSSSSKDVMAHLPLRSNGNLTLAMDALTRIYTLVTKEMILDNLPRDDSFATAVEFQMALEAEIFVANSIPDLSGYLLLARDSREESFRKSFHYNGGLVPMADIIGLRKGQYVQKTFRVPIKWVFTLGPMAESDSDASRALRNMTQAAIRSAMQYSGGQVAPVCVTSTAYGSAVAKWLLSLGARVIYHTPAWISQSVLSWKQFGCENGGSYREPKAQKAVGDLLRVDVPVLGMVDNFLLVTSNQVLFTSALDWKSLLGDNTESKRRMKKNDFAHGKFSFAQRGQTGVPEYFATSCGPEQCKEPADAAVMLMNRRMMQETYLRFRNNVWSKLKTTCSPDLNQLYHNFYRDKAKETLATFLPSIYNWRPFWAPNSSAVLNNMQGINCRGGGGVTIGVSHGTGNLAPCNSQTCDTLCEMIQTLTS